MNTVARRIATVLVAGALLLAGCMTPGGYGGYPGGGYGQPGAGYPSQYANQVEGTVQGVDPAYGRILLRVEDWQTGRDRQVEVRYDRGTRLFYQGREYPVEGLERGDVIRVDVAGSGRDLWARSIQVVRNIRDSGYGGGYGGNHGGGYGNDYGNDPGHDLRGQVAFIDTRSRLIHLDGAEYGGSVQVRYDDRTTAEYPRRLVRPQDLDRGDVVRIQARRLGNNEWLAERIIVERPGGY